MATANPHTISQWKYDREHTRQMFIRLNRTTEPELIARLEQVGNKSGYIKRLIREQIRREAEADDGK